MCCLNIKHIFVLGLLSQLMFGCAQLQTTTDEPAASEKPAAVVAPKGYNEAMTAAKKGNSKSAIKLLTQVTVEYPDFSIAHTNLGLQYLSKGKITAAEQSLRKAISVNSKDAIAYNHLGVILRKHGKFTEARDMYIKAIENQSNYANAHLNLGILYDIYLYELSSALEHYKIYQEITNDNDKLVSKWIIDLERRIKSMANK